VARAVHAYALNGYAYAGAAWVMVAQLSVVVGWVSAAHAPILTGVAAARGVFVSPVVDAPYRPVQDHHEAPDDHDGHAA
jgi:hypothetical protein